MKNTIRITLSGASGRMGLAIRTCATKMPHLHIAHSLDEKTSAVTNEAAVRDCDVVLDFSNHEFTPRIAELCALDKKPLIIGTTGHTPDENGFILSQATVIPIVKATNFSTGVNTLFWLIRRAAEILGPDFDLEVVEMHHRLKKDAPSGTATTLVEILADVRKLQLQEAIRHGRHGITGERSQNEIGIHAIRGGDVVGDHTVIFANNGERVELVHKASSRDTFANGALRAANWVIGRSPGLYTMHDVLGLKA